MSQFSDLLKIENKCVRNTRSLNIEDKSVPLLLLGNLAKLKNKEVLVDCEVAKSWTADEVYVASTKLATRLLEIGLKKGDFVAAHCPNSDYKVIAYLAVTGIGAVYTGCLHNAPFGEINRLLKATNASYLISCKENVNQCTDLLEQNSSLKAMFLVDAEEDAANFKSIPKLIRETDLEDCCDLLALASNITGDDLLLIVLTSGSTGAPKTVKVTQRNISAGFFVTQPDYSYFTEHDTIAVYLPFFEPIGVRQLVCALYSGAKACVFVKDSSEKLYKMCEKYKITAVCLFPHLMSEFNKLYTNEMLIKFDKVICTGDAMPLPIAEEFVQKFKPSFLIQLYGTSEAGIITLLPYTPSTHYFKSVGIPAVGAVCKVTDRETGEDLGCNQIGEIRVKSPQVFTGYLENHENIAEPLDTNGFFKTGDGGYYDECGCFYIVNRFTSIIKVKCWSINPLELESLILQNKNVEEAAVVGVEDGVNGKKLKAFVVIKKHKRGEISEQQLLDYVNSQVSDYKQLAGGLVFVDSLKKTRNNKVDRKSMA